MGLRLIIDNTIKKIEKAPTCRLNCELFDHVTGECGINHRINPDDPLLTARCGDMLYKDDDDDNSFYLSSENDTEEKESIFSLTQEEIELDEMTFLEFNGERFNSVESSYPNKPDYPSNRDDTIWYVSPSGTYGCWIINKSHKRFVNVNSSTAIKQAWNKNVYMSPYPMHDHKTVLTLASRMAWYVDEQGYGQYVILSNGKISMISSPKPNGWGN